MILLRLNKVLSGAYKKPRFLAIPTPLSLRHSTWTPGLSLTGKTIDDQWMPSSKCKWVEPRFEFVANLVWIDGVPDWECMKASTS